MRADLEWIDPGGQVEVVPKLDAVRDSKNSSVELAVDIRWMVIAAKAGRFDC
jgi:hypothetical protein